MNLCIRCSMSDCRRCNTCANVCAMRRRMCRTLVGADVARQVEQTMYGLVRCRTNPCAGVKYRVTQPQTHDCSRPSYEHTHTHTPTPRIEPPGGPGHVQPLACATLPTTDNTCRTPHVLGSSCPMGAHSIPGGPFGSTSPTYIALRRRHWRLMAASPPPFAPQATATPRLHLPQPRRSSRRTDTTALLGKPLEDARKRVRTWGSATQL